MTAGLLAAVAALPVALAVAAGAEHGVTELNPAARRVLGAFVVGSPVREAAPDPALLDALDRAFGEREQTAVALAEPRFTVECVPVRGGVLLHLRGGEAGDSGRHSRSLALQRLVSGLLGALTPSAIEEQVVTAAAGLLGADAAGAYARADDETLAVLHSTGWSPEIVHRYERIELERGRPLSDAVLGGSPVWLEDAEQWRRRYPDM